MQKYEKPQFECIKFEVEDVITTSWIGGGDELPPVDFGLRDGFDNVQDINDNIDLAS